MQFPEDFKLTSHPVIPGAIQYKATKENGSIISVVGGGDDNFLHGDGVTTFEMWDFDTPEPVNYQTASDINDYLKTI